MIRIRAYRPDDAPALCALFHQSVRQGALRDYSAAQVAAWSPAPPEPDTIRQWATTRAVLVAVDSHDAPIAYGDVQPDGHIDHLYCHPDHIGTGVGRALVHALEGVARKAGIAVLTVRASEAARRLLLCAGFVVTTRHDFPIRGVAIHNYSMRKPLD